MDDISGISHSSIKTNRELLSKLTRRGPGAFEWLCCALEQDLAHKPMSQSLRNSLQNWSREDEYSKRGIPVGLDIDHHPTDCVSYITIDLQLWQIVCIMNSKTFFTDVSQVMSAKHVLRPKNMFCTHNL